MATWLVSKLLSGGSTLAMDTVASLLISVSTQTELLGVRCIAQGHSGLNINDDIEDDNFVLRSTPLVHCIDHEGYTSLFLIFEVVHAVRDIPSRCNSMSGVI